MARKEKKKPEVIDLSRIMLSQDAVTAWTELAQRLGATLQTLRIDAKDIPDEQGRIETDGNLTIFVELPGGKGEISLRVPPGAWARAH